jgi:hypothetical protein
MYVLYNQCNGAFSVGLGGGGAKAQEAKGIMTNIAPDMAFPRPVQVLPSRGRNWDKIIITD